MFASQSNISEYKGIVQIPSHHISKYTWYRFTEGIYRLFVVHRQEKKHKVPTYLAWQSIKHRSLERRNYLSSAIFFVWPQPKLKTTIHLSIMQLPSSLIKTSTVLIFVILVEPLKIVESWNFFELFPWNGLRETTHAGSTLTEKYSLDFSSLACHVNRFTWVRKVLKTLSKYLMCKNKGY
mgnify:CR=1 FL=1